VKTAWLKFYGYKTHAFCFNNPGESHQYLEIEEALKCKYLRINPKTRITMLVIDYDQSDIYDRLADNDILPPNLIVINPETGNSHLWYYLENGVKVTQDRKSPPETYFWGVARNMRGLISGDPDFTSTFIRNPWYPGLEVKQLSSKPYTLEELAAYANRYKPIKVATKRKVTSRNLSLFETLRAEARTLRMHDISREDLFDKLEEKAWNFNATNPLGQLNDSEVKSTLKSVFNWAWNVFDPVEHRAKQKRRVEKRWIAKTERIPGQEGLYSQRDITRLAGMMYERHDSLQSIADTLGISYASASQRINRLRNEGLLEMRAPKSDSIVIEKYLNGLEAKEIAKELDMPLSTVYYKIKNARKRVTK
jgi:transposase